MTIRATEQQITDGAKWLAKNVTRYAWDGLRKDGRSSDNGYMAWGVGGHFNARQEDYRDAVRGILMAMYGAEGESQPGESK